MTGAKTVKINGKDYLAVRTIRFRTSYGYAGKKGVEMFEVNKDGSKKMGRFDSVAEFRKTLKPAGKRK